MSSPIQGLQNYEHDHEDAALPCKGQGGLLVTSTDAHSSQWCYLTLKQVYLPLSSVSRRSRAWFLALMAALRQLPFTNCGRSASAPSLASSAAAMYAQVPSSFDRK